MQHSTLNHSATKLFPFTGMWYFYYPTRVCDVTGGCSWQSGWPHTGIHISITITMTHDCLLTGCVACVINTPINHYHDSQHCCCHLLKLAQTTTVGPQVSFYYSCCFVLTNIFSLIGYICGMTTLQGQDHNDSHHIHHTSTQQYCHKQLLAGWEWAVIYTAPSIPVGLCRFWKFQSDSGWSDWNPLEFMGSKNGVINSGYSNWIPVDSSGILYKRSNMNSRY